MADDSAPAPFVELDVLARVTEFQLLVEDLSISSMAQGLIQIATSSSWV